MFKNAAIRCHCSTVKQELTSSQLDQIAGGMGRKAGPYSSPPLEYSLGGGYVEVNGGLGFGPVGVNASVSYATNGDVYAGGAAGIHPLQEQFGVSGGASAGVIFVKNGHTVDDFMSGESTAINAHLVEVRWNDSGVSVGLSTPGVSVTNSYAVNLSENIKAVQDTWNDVKEAWDTAKSYVGKVQDLLSPEGRGPEMSNDVVNDASNSTALDHHGMPATEAGMNLANDLVGQNAGNGQAHDTGNAGDSPGNNAGNGEYVGGVQSGNTGFNMGDVSLGGAGAGAGVGDVGVGDVGSYEVGVGDVGVGDVGVGDVGSYD